MNINNNWLSIIFLVVTAFSYLFVAWWASKGKKTHDHEGYLLGNRSFNIKSITMTLIATQLGAGMIFGTATESYNKGVWGIAYVMGMAIGLILLSLGIGSRLRGLNISTTAEIFQKKYNSVFLRRFAALISILTMGGILAAQIVASKQLYTTWFDASILWLIGFWLVVIAYTTFGGMRAVIATDILQVCIIVLVFTTVLFYIVPLDQFTNLLSNSAEKPEQEIFSDGLFAALLAPILFSLIEQDLAQRCFAAKTKRVASISAFIAAAFLLMYAFVPILLGLYAKSLDISFSSDQSPLVLLFQQKLPPIGMTIVASALLAAICSTADSLLGAASTNLIADFLPKESKNSVIISRLLTFIVGSIALIVAFNFNNVIGIIVKSYEISVCSLFIPIMAAIFIKSPSKISAYFSVFSGTLTFLFTNQTAFALVVSSIGLLAGIACDKFLNRKTV